MRRSGGLAVFLLTALFRGAGLGVVALAALAWLDAGPAFDSWLAAGLAGLALGAWGVRGLVRRGLSPHGARMAAALALLAVAIEICAARTGGLASPVVVVLGALVATAALSLAPLVNFAFLSVVCLQHVLLAMRGDGPVSVLVVELGLLLLLGHLVNRLAWHLRAQLAELSARDLRDAETGVLRGPLFHARLVARLEGAPESGMALLLLEAGDAARLVEAGAALLENVREADLLGRVGRTRFAVASACRREHAPAVARRLQRALAQAGCDARAGYAHALPGQDPLETARNLVERAEAALDAERIGSAA